MHAQRCANPWRATYTALAAALPPQTFMPDNARHRAVATSAWAGASIVTGTMATLLAANHPLWPDVLPWVVAAAMLAAYRCPRAWLFALPACLPGLNLAPWTGWIGVEELDMLVLAAVAAGYARLARDAPSRPPRLSQQGRAAVMAIALLTAAGLWRGVADAGGWQLGWFQDYAEPLNSLRVAKSAVHALLLLPLLRQAWCVDREAAFRRFALGMAAGAALLTLAVLWERAAFPGLLNIESHYRSVGLFWEMHIGGAAIDAYVVLCTPFVVWALWAARSKGVWLAAAVFALLWAYTALTTFSRGAYLGVAAGLLVLGLLMPVTSGQRWWPAARGLAYVLGSALLLALVLEGWGYGASALALVALGIAFWLRWRSRGARRQRTLAAGLLVLVLVFEAVVMVGPDSFMSSRVAKSALDYESRTAHWARGIGLLQTPGDWLFGFGLGRLPAHYDRYAPGGEFSGHAEWRSDGHGGGHARISGPRSRAVLGGRYGLTQRVPLVNGYRMSLDVRAERPAVLLVRVCESHLLYDRACQGAFLRLTAEDQWQSRKLVLGGQSLAVGRWFAPRQGVLTLSVLDAGSSVDIDNMTLESPGGRPALDNGEFATGLARWYPAAQSYFLPWHIDNLYLELLIERGLVGAIVLLGWVAVSGRRLLQSTDLGGGAGAPFIAASLCGVLGLGLLSSVLDAPRIALLIGLLLVMSTLRVK
jgi:hypothetical protein